MGKSVKADLPEPKTATESSTTRAPILNSIPQGDSLDHTHPEYVLRRQRLLFLYKISAPILVFYCIQAIALRLPFTLFLDSITITLFIASLRTYTSTGNLEKASWQYLIAFSVLVGLTPLVDHQLKSSVIWMLPLIPLIAAHLLGARAALVVAAGTAVTMVGTWISTLWWTIAPEHHFKLFDKVLLHEFSLLIASGLALSALRTTKTQILVMRKQQKLLRKAHASTQEAREAKSQFLANMSHEIRTPLNGILGITELLAQGCKEEHSRATLQIAQDCGNRLLDLLNGLLDLSKLEAGKLKLREERFALFSVLSEVRRKFSQSCVEHNIRLEIENDVQDLMLEGDAKRLLQLLSLFIDNSIKHSQGRNIVLSVRADDKRQVLLCAVCDDGIGMADSPNMRDKAVASQVQIRLHESRKGAGIGLVLASRLVELMQGELRFETAPYRGMKTELVIPMRIQGPIPLESGRRREESFAARIASMRVLLVDDNAVNRLVASKVLRQFDCTVQQAQDGLEAVQIAQGQAFDLILMDLHMPLMNGLEATRVIRREAGPNQRTPIAALTAGEYDEGLADRHEAGMNDFLNKPIERLELQRILIKYQPSIDPTEAQSA